uniref:GAG-pre-integrase domain-containing protein n=1 Tax=Lactuca sativa TaxID=4236 RepID=A0A9R1WAQ5_LACSA|nr:hypothetical protein LSAT_V11C300122340 [Lactuca sativa]
MLATMIPNLQRDPKLFTTFDMIEHLKQMFGQQARTERWDKSISELHWMLKTTEKNILRKPTEVLMIREGQVKMKNQGKNSKGKTQKRKCRKYLVELKNKKVGEGPLGISIFMIEMGLYNFLSNTWVLDIGCGTRICNSLQGFRRSKELKTYEMVFHVGDGARVAVQVIGHLHLCLPYDDTSNDNSLYHINIKRIKQGLNQAYLWHRRLGHINKKCISQLQRSGLLGANDTESFEIRESCLCGKMRKASFSGISERESVESVLLGIIHTDVCGLFKTMS